MPRARATFWTIDAETDPFHNCQDKECEKCHGGGRLPLPFLWGVYEGDTQTYLEFQTVEALGKWFIYLERYRGRQTFYAHNGGKFDYHFFRDRVTKQEIQVRFISSKDQLVDVLTKPLPPVSFAYFRSKFGWNLYLQLDGVY